MLCRRLTTSFECLNISLAPLNFVGHRLEIDQYGDMAKNVRF